MQTAKVHFPRESLRKHLVPDVHQRAQVYRRGPSFEITGKAQEEKRGAHGRARVAHCSAWNLSDPLLLAYGSQERIHDLLRHHDRGRAARLLCIQYVHDGVWLLHPVYYNPVLLWRYRQGPHLQ